MESAVGGTDPSALPPTVPPMASNVHCRTCRRWWHFPDEECATHFGGYHHDLTDHCVDVYPEK